MSNSSKFSRRAFLANSGNLIKSTAVLQAFSALGSSLIASGCGSSSAATSVPTNPA